MRKILFILTALALWLPLRADQESKALSFGSSQEEFSQLWSVIGSPANWEWEHYTSNYTTYYDLAKWTTTAPIPEEGAILAYNTGIPMGEGTTKVTVRVSAAPPTGSGSSYQCFEVILSTDADFSNPSNFLIQKGAQWTGTFTYRDYTFTVPKDGIYYVGLRIISGYDSYTTQAGSLRVMEFSVAYETPTEIPTPPVAEALPLPYENALNYAGCLDGFTLTPETGGWQFTVNNTVVINGPGTGTTQAKMVTPALAVEEDGEYEISFDASGNPNSTLKVLVGPSLESLEEVFSTKLENSMGSFSKVVSGNAEGVLYVAFDGDCFARSSIQLSNLRVAEYVAPVAALPLPYENALNYAGCLDGFTLTPETGGWQFTVNNTVVINGPGTGTTQAKMVTPALAVEEDGEYEISFDASGNPNSTLKVLVGPSLESLEEVYSATLANSMGSFSKVVSGNAEGVLYVAFDGDCFARSSIQLSNLRVAEYVPTLSITDATVYDCEDGTLQFTIVYVAENLPEDTTITAVITESSIELEEEFELTENPAVVEIKDLEEGSYNFTIVLKAGDLTTEPISVQAVVTTGIESIMNDIDNGTLYYDINGFEVKTPNYGFYIRVKNGQREKVFIKNIK